MLLYNIRNPRGCGRRVDRRHYGYYPMVGMKFLPRNVEPDMLLRIKLKRLNNLYG